MRNTALKRIIELQHEIVAEAGIVRQVLGKQSEQVMAAAYLSPGHDYSYETVHFAEIDGAAHGPPVEEQTSVEVEDVAADLRAKPLLAAARATREVVSR